MYDDLVKRLRSVKDSWQTEEESWMLQAADAIEDLEFACIRDTPTADVVERKVGKWIEYVNSHCECPFCHKEWSFFENMTEWFNYCPNCGAEMKGEEADV